MYARLQELRLGGAVLPKPRRAPQPPPPPPPHSPQSACPRPPPSPAPPPPHHHRAHHSRGDVGRTRRIPAPSGLARALTEPKDMPPSVSWPLIVAGKREASIP